MKICRSSLSSHNNSAKTDKKTEKNVCSFEQTIDYYFIMLRDIRNQDLIAHNPNYSL